MAELTHEAIETLLETGGSSGSLFALMYAFPWRRRIVMLLLGASWIISTVTFVDVFIASPSGGHWSCTCNGTPVPHDIDVDSDDWCSTCDGGPPDSCDTSTSLAADFELYCDDRWRVGLLSTLFFSGAAVGATVAGPMGDRFGRRAVWRISWAAFAVVYPCSALSPSFAVYALLKFVAGMFISGVSTSGFTLSSELCGASQRARLTVELWNYYWALMCVLTAGVLGLVSHWSWRLQLLMTSVPAIVLWLPAVALVPESPHWLLDQGETRAARDAIALLLGSEHALPPLSSTGICGGAAPNGTPLLSSTTVSSHHVPSEAAASAGAPARSGSANASADHSVASLCSSAATGRVTAAQMYLWLTVALSYYAISFNAGNLSDNTYVSFVLISLPLFPSGYVSRLMMDHPRLGRRLTNTGLISVLVPVIAVGAIFESAATAASMIGTFAANGAFNVVYVQTAELFPTAVRNTAISLCIASSRIGTLAAGNLPVLFGSSATLAVIATLAFFAAPLTFFVVPETLGHGLSAELPTPRRTSWAVGRAASAHTALEGAQRAERRGRNTV